LATERQVVVSLHNTVLGYYWGHLLQRALILFKVSALYESFTYLFTGLWLLSSNILS